MSALAVPNYSSYIICGTPRSGSTLMCEMLAVTGVAGRPNSYYRQPSLEYWADIWGVAHPNGIDDPAFERAYHAAMLREGTNGTGIFGLRLMWSSVANASRRLNGIYGGPADITTRFEQAFGKPLYVHLSRHDKVAQAISRLRAEQSGLWHLAADGSVFEGTESPQPVAYDEARLAAFFTELKSDDAAWEAFFQTHKIEPLRLTYETMTDHPQPALASILAALFRDPEIAKTIDVGTAKMADATSREWSDRFRKENGLS